MSKKKSSATKRKTRAKAKPARVPKEKRGLSIAGYAKHRKDRGLPGHSPSTVQWALKTGKITRNDHGKIDPEQADRDWLRNTEPRAHKPQPKPTTPKEQAQAEGVKAPRHIPDYHESRAELEFWKAKLAEIDVEKAEGRLILAEDAKREGYRIGRTIRDRILSIPDRIAPELAAIDQPREITRRLEAELREALTALASLEEADDAGD